MRILWWGDGASHTGFGIVSQQIGDRLVTQYGHDVHCLAVNHLGDHWPTAMKLYVPTMFHPKDIYGESRILELMGSLVPDALIVVNDPHMVLRFLFRNPYDTTGTLFRGFPLEAGGVYRPPMLTYTPIDGYDSPRSWDIVGTRARRIAMTHFGQEAMGGGVPVVWHGVDTEVFRPRDKREAKRQLGLDPDRFFILRVDKNSIRKDYAATWLALRPILRKYRDIDVHFHCDAAPYDSYDLNALRYNDEDIRDRVSFTASLADPLGSFTGGSSLEHLATLYAAADLFVSTSWGEGFGLTLLEAIASGTPVIAQDCSSIPEVVGPGGILVPPLRKLPVPMGQFQCQPDIDAFSAEIEHLYLAGGVRRKLAEAGVQHAQKFSWDIATAKIDEQLRLAVEGQVNAVFDELEPATSDQA